MAGSQAAGAARDAAGRLSLLRAGLLRYFANTQEIVTSSAFSVDLNKLVSSKAKCLARVSQQIRLLRLVVIGNRSKLTWKQDSFLTQSSDAEARASSGGELLLWGAGSATGRSPAEPAPPPPIPPHSSEDHSGHLQTARLAGDTQ